MKEHRLCSSCIQKGLTECWFKTRTLRRIEALPPSEKQTPIAKGITITKEAFEVHEKIEKDRTYARDKRLCPEVNFNPQDPKFQPNL